MPKTSYPIPMGTLVYSVIDNRVGRINGYVNKDEAKIRFSNNKYDYSYRKISTVNIIKTE